MNLNNIVTVDYLHTTSAAGLHETHLKSTYYLCLLKLVIFYCGLITPVHYLLYYETSELQVTYYPMETIICFYQASVTAETVLLEGI